MIGSSNRSGRMLGQRLAAVPILLSLLLLNIASDRLHNHSGAEEGLVSVAPSPAGAHWAGPLASHPSRRGVVCVACLYHRTYGVGPSAGLFVGRTAALPNARLALAPVPPPAPHSRPAGLRAPPIS